MRQEVAAGGNPADRKKEGRATAGSKSFGALAKRYLAEHAERRKRSHKRDARNLEFDTCCHTGATEWAAVLTSVVEGWARRLFVFAKGREKSI
jgi:hypothetical protein